MLWRLSVHEAHLIRIVFAVVQAMPVLQGSLRAHFAFVYNLVVMV